MYTNLLLNIFNTFKTHYQYFVFFFLIVLTGCLEIAGLYSVLGLDPYILIAIVITIIKGFLLLTKDWKVFIILIVTTFFSVQKPMLLLIDSNINNSKITYYENLISGKQLEYDNAVSYYKSLQKNYDNAVKDKAWGITRGYDRNDTLNTAMNNVNNLKNQLSDAQLQLLNFKENNESWYKSVLRLIIITLSEFLLFLIASRLGNKKIKESEPIIATPIIKPKRKYTRKTPILKSYEKLFND